MAGRLIGFIIWALTGSLFVFLGIASFCSKKPMGFWANAKMYEVNDLKKYNCAVGKLYISYGVGMILLGLPLLLSAQNSPLILLSIVGIMVESLVIMIIYSLVITKKYQKK